jgi:hypothetical protein
MNEDIFPSKNNLTDDEARRQLYGAIYAKDNDKVTELLNKYLNTFTVKNINVAFTYAARFGNIQTIRILTEKFGEEKSKPYRDEMLCCASEVGQDDTVNFLLDNYSTDISPASKGDALCKAVREKHVSTVNVLVNRCGSDIDAEDKGNALISWPDRPDDTTITDILLKNFWNGITREDKGRALWSPAAHGYQAKVEMLLDKYGNDIDVRYKQYAIKRAKENKHNAVVQLLEKDLENNDKKSYVVINQRDSQAVDKLIDEAKTENGMPVGIGNTNVIDHSNEMHVGLMGIAK